MFTNLLTRGGSVPSVCKRVMSGSWRLTSSVGSCTDMASGDVEDFIEQNRHLSDLVETFRSISESNKHWKSRREFIFRNINDYEDPHLDHLLALSMVWANHVFLGCRYNPSLLEEVKVMAEGIVVEDAPVFKTRDELIKQQQKR